MECNKIHSGSCTSQITNTLTVKGEKLKMTIQLNYIGEDSWNRPVYEDDKGNIFKDINLGDGELALCTVSSFDGEPDTPIEYIERYKKAEFKIHRGNKL